MPPRSTATRVAAPQGGVARLGAARRLAARALWPFASTQGFQRLSSSALLMTLTELSAIAAPASTGFR